MIRNIRARPPGVLLAVLFVLAACSMDGAERHFLLGEKLWADGNYSAAVGEFERARKRDPKGLVGLKSLFRAATTQTLFLQEHVDAIDKLREYVRESKDAESLWSAKLMMGEILFSKLNQYDQAQKYYEDLAKENPHAPEKPEFLFRAAKSAFHAWKFDVARQKYEELRQEFPQAPQSERALYEIGMVYFTAGEQRAETLGVRPTARAQDGKDVFRKAIEVFGEFLKKYPKSSLKEDARFAIASSLEELDQLEEAMLRYQNLMETYPSPGVIQIKVARITERLRQRNVGADARKTKKRRQ